MKGKDNVRLEKNSGLNVNNSSSLLFLFQYLIDGKLFYLVQSSNVHCLQYFSVSLFANIDT